MIRPALAIGICASVLLDAPAALSQTAQEQSCGPRAEVVTKLNQRFKENQEAAGLVNELTVMELFVSGEGTWTIIASGTDGMSCIVSAGIDWDGPHFIKGFDTKLRQPATALPDRAD